MPPKEAGHKLFNDERPSAEYKRESAFSQHGSLSNQAGNEFGRVFAESACAAVSPLANWGLLNLAIALRQ